MSPLPPRGGRAPPALVLSGGVALGAFEAGACAALEEAGGPPPRWIAAASVGAVNAALFAAAPPGEGGAALRRFWESLALEPAPLTRFLLGPAPQGGAWRAAHNRAAALHALLLGRPGLFRPDLRLCGGPAFYDLGPLRARLEEMLDLDRLNRGPVRVSIVATDAETGARVVFDTGRGDRLTVGHLLASGAMPPLVPPVEVEGRRLLDGRLSGEAPLDLVLAEAGAEAGGRAEPWAGALTCLVVDQPRPARRRPRALRDAGEVAAGQHARRLLAGAAREWELRARMASLARHLPAARRETPEVARLLRTAGVGGTATVMLLGYRPALDEGWPGKGFDFSAATLADRWRAGGAAMAEALGRLLTPDRGEELAPGLRLHEVTAMPARWPPANSTTEDRAL